MKQASAAAAHGRVFAGLRGKYTARPHDRDMNTVYVTAFSVHTEFPLRPLSEPGWLLLLLLLTEGRDESKLFFWRATLSRAGLNPALSSPFSSSPPPREICIPKRATLLIMNLKRASGRQFLTRLLCSS